MPTGVVRWFDPKTGEGIVASRGREFAVRAEDLEPEARVPGARVHFDRARDGGADRAVRVRMRPGTRSSRRQHRFGDLTGAHRPADKGHEPSLNEPPMRAGRSSRVVEEWARAVGDGDPEAAAALYAPDATIHAEGVDLTGPRAIRRWLESGGLLGSSGMGVEIHARNGSVVVTWPPTDEVSVPTLVQLRVAHGRIAEQWITRS